MSAVSDMFSQLKSFSSNQFVQGGKDFLESNSIVAKFAFLIFVLLCFILLISLGSYILSLIFSNNHTPFLLNGMIDSRQMQVIAQDPSKKGAVPIIRSNNEREGLEFTWSVWIFVDDFSYKEHEYKHVFHKGNNNINLSGSKTGINFPNNAPGLYINPDVNAITIIMNTFDTINDEVVVNNLPLNKWVNIIIRVTKQNQLDVYINGTLTKRHMLNGIPKQNYGDVYVSLNGGFSGNTSDLRYFDTAIGTSKIQSIVNKGPSTKASSSMGSLDLEKDSNKYLSNRWYLSSVMDS